jgi:hypothetical protein
VTPKALVVAPETGSMEGWPVVAKVPGVMDPVGLRGVRKGASPAGEVNAFREGCPTRWLRTSCRELGENNRGEMRGATETSGELREETGEVACASLEMGAAWLIA